jgi:hypothetical protein
MRPERTGEGWSRRGMERKEGVLLDTEGVIVVNILV